MAEEEAGGALVLVSDEQEGESAVDGALLPSIATQLSELLQKRAPLPGDALKRMQPTRARRLWPIDFGPVDVAPGATVSVVAQPRAAFRGEKIINTGDVDDLEMVAFFIGQLSQFSLGMGPVPLSVFAPNSLSSGTNLDVCDAALMMTIQVRNVGEQPRKFAMVIVGSVIE